MKPRRAAPDWALEAVGLAALLAAIALAVYSWNDLSNGTPRRLFRPAFYSLYTVKNALWVVLGLNALAYAGLTVATHFGRLFNIPAEIERDLPHAPQLLFSMVIVMKAVLMLFGAYLTWSLVEVGLGRQGGVTLEFVLFFFLLVPVPLIFYTVKVRKYP